MFWQLDMPEMAEGELGWKESLGKANAAVAQWCVPGHVEVKVDRIWRLDRVLPTLKPSGKPLGPSSLSASRTSPALLSASTGYRPSTCFRWSPLALSACVRLWIALGFTDLTQHRWMRYVNVICPSS